MTPELRDLLTALVADVRRLAHLIDRLAGNTGYPDTAEEARSIADDILDAWNQL